MASIDWIKLSTDLLENRKIKYLRRMSEGDSLVLIWILLLTLAGKCNDGGLIYLTRNKPYTAEMLADELGFTAEIIKRALQELTDLEMIYTTGDGFVQITDWDCHQNIEGMEKIREQNRIRKQRQRDNQKGISTAEDVCHVTSRDSHAIDKNRIDKNRIDIYSCSNFERFWEAYPKKVGKEAARKSFAKMKDVPIDIVLDSIERHKQSDQWKRDDGRYIPYPATWINQGRWQDEIELPEEKARKELRPLPQINDIVKRK